MKTKNRELKIIFMVTGALFVLFLVYPTVRLLLKSILSENGILLLSIDAERFFNGVGKQFPDCGSQCTSYNRTGIFPCLYHSLYKYPCKIQKRN